MYWPKKRSKAGGQGGSLAYSGERRLGEGPQRLVQIKELYT